MPTVFNMQDAAIEESTFVITIAFQNEDGDPVVPNSANWTLTDMNGTVVNERSEVDIPNLAASKDIVLTDADLAFTTGFKGHSQWRIFTVKGEYNSNLGTDLPLNDFCKFPIINAAAI